MTAQETDPNGLRSSAPGAKLDEGKLLAGLLQQWSRALTAVLEVATFGANKYSRGGWQEVDNGVERYTDAMFRHLLQEKIEPVDPDSKLLHEAHVAWNALSRLELMLRAHEEGGQGEAEARRRDNFRKQKDLFTSCDNCTMHTYGEASVRRSGIRSCYVRS